MIFIIAKNYPRKARFYWHSKQKKRIRMKKILVIEDHLEVRENLQELLELCNYHVICAPNGEDGIELAISEQPDLILCDIMMPGMDGYEVLAFLCQHPETAAIPFIFLSARADKADIRRGMQQGADDYLTKPFEEEELLKAIQVRLQKSHLAKPGVPVSGEGLHEFLFHARKESGQVLDTEIMSGIKKYSPGQFIFREGEDAEFLYFIASGKVSLYRPEQPGYLPIASHYEKGSFFGYRSLIQGLPYLHRAEAIEATEVWLISKNDFFMLLLHNRTFSARFIQMLANRVSEQEKQLLKMVQVLSQKTVAQTILELYTVKTDQIPLEAVQSRARVASLNLTLALHHLDREKIIALSPEGIRMLDSKKLRMVANG